LAKKTLPVQLPKWLVKRMGKAYYRLNFDKDFANAGVFAVLLGGHPEECPEQYALFSPITHVQAHCPTTILIQGEHDLMAPVNATRFLHTRLVEEKVPAVMHILPQTDHAFDLILPKISPSAHTAIYDVERFLALRVNNAEPLIQLKNSANKS
jgi:acetyl esterase/lipase